MLLPFRQSWTADLERRVLMTPPDKIRILRDRVLAELNAAHDYYADTQAAWDIVGQTIAAGRTFTHFGTRSPARRPLTNLVSKARGYVAKELAEATFQQFISIFESYFFDLLHLWLMTYPQNLAAKKVDYKVILDTPDKGNHNPCGQREVNEIMYERPWDWFAYLGTCLAPLPAWWLRGCWCRWRVRCGGDLVWMGGVEEEALAPEEPPVWPAAESRRGSRQGGRGRGRGWGWGGGRWE